MSVQRKEEFGTGSGREVGAPWPFSEPGPK
jgi:hypothetical protein